MVAAKGYCTQDDVEALLGATLTPVQEDNFAILLPAAEAYIDARTGLSWLAGAVTDQAYFDLDGPLLWLRGAPLASSTVTVKVRASSTDTERTLTAGTDYDVEDLTSGRVRLYGWQDWQRVRVSYTPSEDVDARITQAARQLVAFWLGPQHNGAEDALKAVSFGQDLKVEYDTAATARGIPPTVDALLDSIGAGAVAFA